MNLYYEADGSYYGEPGKYWVQRNVLIIHNTDGPRMLYERDAMLFANRVWQEDNTGVKYIKNRIANIDTLPDTEEFMWIKLQARPLL